MSRLGWAARACFWSSASSDSRTGSRSSQSTKAGTQSERPSRASRPATARRAKVWARPRQTLCPLQAPCWRRRRRPARRQARWKSAGVINSSSPLAAPRIRRAAARSTAARPRCGATRQLVIVVDGESDAAISAPRRSRASVAPQAHQADQMRPRRRSQLDRQLLSVSLTEPSRVAGRSLGQPRASASQDRLVHRGLAAGKAARKVPADSLRSRLGPSARPPGPAMTSTSVPRRC